MKGLKGKRATIAYVLSNLLSLLGNSVAGVVLPLVLLATTGDALAAGALAVFCAVPQFAAGVLGGAVLDRFDRRKVSIVADIVSALSVVALPIVHMTVGLSFGWFVLFGVLGAIGDVPGMTARDTLLPIVVKHDGIDLQRFMGTSQSLEGIIAIVGPAVAAMSMGAMGATNALWFTAAMSACAAFATLFIPKDVGEAPVKESIESFGALLKAAVVSTKNGTRVLLKSDAIVTCSVILDILIVMVMGSWQALVMPVYFTEIGEPQLLGFLVSAMSFGALFGSLGYTALAHLMKRRTWFVLSVLGTAVGVAIMGVLPSYPLLLVGALVLGVSSGPFSALLNFFMFDRIPNDAMGGAMGTLNSMMLIGAPASIFVASAIVSLFGVGTAALVLAGVWVCLSVFGIVVKPMRQI